MKLQKKFLNSLWLISSLYSLIVFPNISYADDPFAAFKKIVEDIQKDLGENGQNSNTAPSEPKTTSDNKPTKTNQPTQANNSSGNLCNNEDEIYKIENEFTKVGCDAWNQTEQALVNSPNNDLKKENAKNAAIMEAFRKKFPEFPVSYSFKTEFAKNLLDAKYGLVEKYDLIPSVTPGSTMGRPDPSKNQYSYTAIITFKNISADKKDVILQDAHIYNASSTNNVFDVNYGMQMPKTIEEARVKAVHSAMEDFYSTPFPLNTNYDNYIEKLEVIKEGVEFMPVSKLKIYFKRIPQEQINQIRDSILPGYGSVFQARSNYFNERIRIVKDLAKALNIPITEFGDLNECTASGTCVGDFSIESQIMITDSEKGIRELIEKGSLTEENKIAIRKANQQRLQQIKNFVAESQQGQQRLAQKINSTEGMNKLALSFINLEIGKRINGLASKEKNDIARLEYKMNNPEKGNVEKIDQATEQELLNSLGE